MPLYRLVVLDPQGRVTRRFEFRAGDDLVAEAAAEHLGDHRVKQLWEGARWVRTWAPPPSRAPEAGAKSH
ncbi:hypothetical protein [Phenylobacterium soli]|uniref:Uncharacterized protein n=1 Tax=Phenylobacterium soli TaxID=2170551 RepID=A0A328AJD8_9CAUL|nr:hypothetical protein [Phenylobacterium soli]RAK54186.1 hypothetical protein DJ017_06455 [Phenylobacterium soli]